MADFILFQQPNGEWAKIAVSLDGDGVATILTAPAEPLPFGPGAGGYVAGRYYTLGDGNIIATAVAAADRLMLYCFDVFAPLDIASLFARCTTLGTGSAMKAGIWADLNGRPTGAPIMADNTGAATTATGIIPLAASGLLPVGRYWAGAKFTGTLPAMLAYHGSEVRFASMVGAATAAEALNNGATNQATTVYVASTYADPMPDLTSASFTVNTVAQGVPVIGALVATP